MGLIRQNFFNFTLVKCAAHRVISTTITRVTHITDTFSNREIDSLIVFTLHTYIVVEVDK